MKLLAGVTDRDIDVEALGVCVADVRPAAGVAGAGGVRDHDDGAGIVGTDDPRRPTVDTTQALVDGAHGWAECA